MIESNWLPFVHREVFRLKGTLGTEPTAVELGSFGVGSTLDRVLLQDFCLKVGSIDTSEREPNWNLEPAVPIRSLMRYGYKHRGYLQERPILYGGHITDGLDIPLSWSFHKPYTIFPGEVLRVNYNNPNLSTSARKPGAVFNAVRLLDERPHLLYSSANKLDDGQPLVLNQPGLTCPADSPVAIHGVSLFGRSEMLIPLSGSWQITGPDDREWFESRIIRFPGLAVPPEIQWGRMVAHRCVYTTLGEEWGWEMKHDEVFIMEVTALDPTPDDFIWFGSLTLRGQLEVQYG
jgi:hypothetical protein